MPSYADKKWKDEFYVAAYKLAREGCSEERVAKHLGVTYHVLRRWKEVRPAFEKALCDGKAEFQSGTAVEAQERIAYNRLPAELRDLWDRVKGAEEREGEDPEVARDKRRARRLLDQEVAKLSVNWRQRLFVHAVMACSFSVTQAKDMIGISGTDIKLWRQEPAFRELLAEAQLAKKDLVESALMDLVREREPAAVIFASKTLNRDRGYNDKTEIALTDERTVSVEEMGLSLEDQKKLLEAVRGARQKALPAPGDVQEAEFSVSENSGGTG